VVSLKNIGPVLQGLLNLSGLAGSEADIDMTVPQAVMLSAYHQLTDHWAVMGNIGWQDWSEFGKQDLTLRATDATTFTQDLGYDDTWHFALGAQYRFAERGCGRWARPTTLRQWMTLTRSHRTCPWTGRFASAPECSMTGMRM
jgi:long-subunit fatty acid transport protein